MAVVSNQKILSSVEDIDLTRVFSPEPSTPPDIVKLAQEFRAELLPQDSKAVYDKQYELYLDFIEGVRCKNRPISSNALLLYAKNLLSFQAPTTVISKMSMIKDHILAKHKVDIFTRIQALYFALFKKKRSHIACKRWN